MRQWVLALFMLAALAPTLSRALMAAQQRIAPWAELCATASVLPDGSRAAGSGGQAAHLLDVCAACTGAPALAGPPAPVALSAERPAEALPLPLPRAAAVAAAWAHAPSRGPPAVA